MDTDTDRDDVLTTGEAAELLRVTKDTLRRYDRGDLPWFETPGGHRRYLRRDLERLQTGNRST